MVLPVALVMQSLLKNGSPEKIHWGLVILLYE